PQAAVPFAAVFAVYAVLWRTWRRQWLLVAAAAAVAVLLELAMFWAKFGDPLFAIKAILSGINRHYVQSHAIRWCSDSPWFFLRRLRCLEALPFPGRRDFCWRFSS